MKEPETMISTMVSAVPESRESPIAAVPVRGTAVVTGAAGFVGAHACRALIRRGWTVRAVVRDAARAQRRLSGLPVQYVIGDLRQPATQRDAVRGALAVVHLAAIAVERAGSTYEAVNTAVTDALVDAAREAGVQRFVHMSQNGASSSSSHRFLRSKGLAEDRVQASDLEWTVLRPSVIFGRGDEFVTVLARLVRLSPLIYPLPGGGTARFQPVSVIDVARVIAIVLDRADTIRQRYPLGGPAVLTLRQMVERVLAAMRTTRLLVPVPVALLHPLVAIAQRVFPRPPVTTELLGLLALDNTVPASALWSTFSMVPTPFAVDELTYLRGITGWEAWKAMWR